MTLPPRMPPPGHPGGESVGTVVPPVFPLHGRTAPELARADDQGILQKSPLLEIPNQSRDGLVDLLRILPMVPVTLAVAVPVGAGQLNEANPALDHASGQKTDSTELPGGGVVHAVHPPDGLGLSRNVNQLGSRCLHAKGQLVVGNTGRQTTVLVPPLQMPVIPPLDLVQHEPLIAFADLRRGRSDY